jgi:hypothetical protein
MLKRDLESMSEILGASAQRASPHSADLFSSSLSRTTKRHETFRLQPADGLLFPNVIVPASGDVEDFFASVATYYQEQSPLSAVVHILSGETANLMFRQYDPSNTSILRLSRPSRIAALGAAIGEAALAGIEAHDVSASISYAACRRTLAFSLCRAKYLYQSTLQPDIFTKRWSRLRKLTGLNVSAAATDAVLCAHASGVGGSKGASNLPHIEPTLSEALRALATRDDSDDNLLVPALVELYPAMKQFLNDLKGAFDGRMTAFTRLVESIRAGSRGIRTDEIAVAFSCNRILPGSFAHVGVLASLVNVFPAALIWYGFLATLSGRHAPQQLNLGLLAKLERDLLEPFSFEQRPRCDISLEELEVLSQAPLRAETIKPTQQRVLLVALLPGVDIYTRFGIESDAIGERVRHSAEADDQYRRAVRILEEALYSLKRVGTVNRDSTTTSVSRRQRKDR